MTTASKRKIEFSLSSGSALLILIWTGTYFVAIGLLALTAINQNKIANKPPAPYAISDTGAQMRLSLETPADKMLRIKRFANKIMVGMYTWSSVLDTKDPSNSNAEVLDKGVSVQDEGGQSTPIPTAAFISTMGLEPNFARAYRQQIANYVRKYEIGPSGNKAQAYFKVRQVSEPIDKGNGNWAVTLVAAQTIFSPGKETVVNHGYQILLRSTQTMHLPDAMKKYKDRELAEYATAISAYELEITSITPL
ncbi:MAG: hypothetical protein ACEQSC_00415 [Candidatus Nanopelagicaceae bacterium]